MIMKTNGSRTESLKSPAKSSACSWPNIGQRDDYFAAPAAFGNAGNRIPWKQDQFFRARHADSTGGLLHGPLSRTFAYLIDRLESHSSRACDAFMFVRT